MFNITKIKSQFLCFKCAGLQMLIVCLCLGLFFNSCKSDNNINNNNDTNVVDINTNQLEIISPNNLTSFILGEKINIKAAIQGGNEADSVFVTFNGKKQITETSTLTFILNTENGQAGTNKIQIKAWLGGVLHSANLLVVLRSNVIPDKYSYKIIKRYPHDSKSYTQGLIFENGYMYEGTGQYGTSMLLKYKLSNNELIQSYNLPHDVFGEGIVISNNKIYQLTWQSHVAYEYEKETFKLINKFDFTTEGWGITNLDENLIMSDGSYTLYVLSPESFNEIKRIEVYDNIGPVNQLNELEFIDGKIYANVYQTNTIVIIDPKTGCVTGKIDLSGLLDKTKVKNQEPDVLNGIAWDAQGKRLFLTGKYWPEVYEVELIKK